MARRKRASMREGPLADLFRSTSDDPSQDPPEFEPRTADDTGGPQGDPVEPAASRTAPEPSPEVHAEPDPDAAGRYGRQDPLEARQEEPEPTQSEPAPAPRSEDPGPLSAPDPAADTSSVPDAQDRLKRIFSETPPDPREDGPRYGRQEPSSTPGAGVPHNPVIRVIGVGGGGVNAINRMIEAQIPGVEFMAVNTDLQSLQLCMADLTVHIGGDETRGLGAGADPSLGFRAAFDEQDRIKRLLKGSDMVFIAAGAGGGTGTGAAPVIARLARDIGALTVGIVTKPFTFEGSRRQKQAEQGIEALAGEVDTLIVIPNDRLLEVLDQSTPMVDAFQVADDVLRQGVQGISDLVTLPSVINLDFADVRSIMSDAGRALLGIGMGSGPDRALIAAEKATSSPLLETPMDGAKSILLSVTGGPDLSLIEVSEAARAVGEAAHPDANIIFGANIDDDLDDQVWITVVATRFDSKGTPARRVERSEGGRRERSSRESRPSRGESLPAVGGGDIPEFLS
ncbi:MAG: cell division protein FtsZ [Solirubrobacterales bacterium]|nr:cell division protein FtsZ [Solirubrobacterales bacterium]